MLVLTLHHNEEVYIDGGRIRVALLEVRAGQARLGFEAPKDMRIDRKKIHDIRAREDQKK
jgi:carbon storage regulator CsrA